MVTQALPYTIQIQVSDEDEWLHKAPHYSHGDFAHHPCVHPLIQQLRLSHENFVSMCVAHFKLQYCINHKSHFLVTIRSNIL